MQGLMHVPIILKGDKVCSQRVYRFMLLAFDYSRVAATKRVIASDILHNVEEELLGRTIFLEHASNVVDHDLVVGHFLSLVLENCDTELLHFLVERTFMFVDQKFSYNTLD